MNCCVSRGFRRGTDDFFARSGPPFEPDVIPFDRDERTRRLLGPGPAVEVEDAVHLGHSREVGVAAGHVPVSLAPSILDRPILDPRAVALPAL